MTAAPVTAPGALPPVRRFPEPVASPAAADEYLGQDEAGAR